MSERQAVCVAHGNGSWRCDRDRRSNRPKVRSGRPKGSAALSRSPSYKPPALPEVADFNGGGDGPTSAENPLLPSAYGPSGPGSKPIRVQKKPMNGQGGAAEGQKGAASSQGEEIAKS